MLYRRLVFFFICAHEPPCTPTYWKLFIEKCAHARTPRIPVRPFVVSHCVCAAAAAAFHSWRNPTTCATGTRRRRGCSWVLNFRKDKMQIFRTPNTNGIHLLSRKIPQKTLINCILCTNVFSVVNTKHIVIKISYFYVRKIMFCSTINFEF